MEPYVRNNHQMSAAVTTRVIRARAQGVSRRSDVGWRPQGTGQSWLESRPRGGVSTTLSVASRVNARKSRASGSSNPTRSRRTRYRTSCEPLGAGDRPVSQVQLRPSRLIVSASRSWWRLAAGTSVWRVTGRSARMLVGKQTISGGAHRVKVLFCVRIRSRAVGLRRPPNPGGRGHLQTVMDRAVRRGRIPGEAEPWRLSGVGPTHRTAG